METRTDRHLPPLDDQDGPAERISARQADLLVSKVLAARGRVGSPWRRRWAAAAIVSLTSASAVSAGYMLRSWRRPAPAAAAPQQRTIPAAADLRPSSPIDDAPGTDATPGASSPLFPPLGHRGARNGSPERSPFSKGNAAPADLLRAANALRAQSRWREAELTYRKIAAEAPRSEEGYAALVAAASLRAEHLHNPAGALLLYRAALRERPTGALAEETRWGIIEVHHVMGNRGLEAAALREFIAAHPASLRRQTAESRLAGGSSATR